MRFITPPWLLLLVPVYALALVYLWMQLRRRERYEVRFTNLALLDVVAPRRPGWRRHVPAALLLLSLAALVVALARPARTVLVPREQATIVLALDVSISMAATDVPPSRLEAARSAAATFADGLPEAVHVGVVAFAGTAHVLVPPTTDRDVLRRALSGLELREATAIGDAVIAALDAVRASPAVPAPAEGGAGGTNGSAPPDEELPAHVVVMSDGEATAGVPVETAAQAASRAGVSVSTIAFGTDHGIIEYQGELFEVPVNGETLRRLAHETGGSFFEAATGAELDAVYADIGSSVGFETELRELTFWFLAVGVILALCTAGASLLWFSRLP